MRSELILGDPPVGWRELTHSLRSASKALTLLFGVLLLVAAVIQGLVIWALWAGFGVPPGRVIEEVFPGGLARISTLSGRLTLGVFAVLVLAFAHARSRRLRLVISRDGLAWSRGRERGQLRWEEVTSIDFRLRIELGTNLTRNYGFGLVLSGNDATVPLPLLVGGLEKLALALGELCPQARCGPGVAWLLARIRTGALTSADEKDLLSSLEVTLLARGLDCDSDLEREF